MEYLSSMPFPNKVYFSQNDLKVFGLLNDNIKKISIVVADARKSKQRSIGVACKKDTG